MYVKEYLMLPQLQQIGYLDPLPDKSIHEGLVNVLKFSEVDARFIMRSMNNNFKSSICCRIDQAACLYHVLSVLLCKTVSIRKIAKICKCDYSKLAKRIKSPRRPHGRPKKLNYDQEDELLTLIDLYASQNRPVSIKFLRQYIFEQFNIDISPSWHRRFIERNSTRIRMDVATPQEDKRLNLPIEYAEKHIQNLIDYLKDIPTELIFNVDEVGHQQWADRKKKKVVVSQTLPKNEVYYSIKRNEKRVSIVAAISMAGDTLVPMIISHRKTIDKELVESGLREGEDYILKYQKSSFIDKEIFSEYVQKILFTYIDEIRKNEIFKNEPAVILCDNCSAHVDDILLKKMKEKNIRFVTFPPHSSHLFQPLDLVTFGVFKIYLKTKNNDISKKSQADIINDIIKALEVATISSNNRSAFKRAGLNINATAKPHRCTIDEEKLRNRIAEANLKHSSSQLNFEKFGFINK